MENPSLETIGNIDYQLMFDNPIEIRRRRLSFFELATRHRRLTGRTLHHKHQYFYKRYLQYVEENRSVSRISITSDDDDESEVVLDLVEVNLRWQSLNGLSQRAWNTRAVRLNNRPTVGLITVLPERISGENTYDLINAQIQIC